MAAARANERGAEQTRRRILEAAYKLFYRRGFARVPLDEIAEQANVTKRTLYYHFRSKDDLLAAVLEFNSEFALNRIREWGSRLPADLDGALDALFEALGRWVAGPHFEGAGYTRLVMELADLPGHPARAISRRHKAEVEAWLAEELASRGCTAPNECARQIQLLLEGASALMLVHGDKDYVRSAATAAKRLVRGSSRPDG
jgi:AcrR family transcriptional regulator